MITMLAQNGSRQCRGLSQRSAALEKIEVTISRTGGIIQERLDAAGSGNFAGHCKSGIIGTGQRQSAVCVLYGGHPHVKSSHL